MNTGFRGFRVHNHGFVLRLEEPVRAIPAICDELVLTDVVEPPNYRVVLYPYEQLRERHARVEHPFAHGEDHLVGVEQVRGVLFRHVRNDRFEPCLREGAVLLVRLFVIVLNFFLLRDLDVQSLFARCVRDSVRCVRADKRDAFATKKCGYKTRVAAVAASDAMVAKRKNVSVTN